MIKDLSIIKPDKLTRADHLSCKLSLVPPTLAAIVSNVSSCETGKHRQAKLWSNLQDIGELLRLDISLSLSIFSEEITFQHVQIKAGQRIYTIGQPFDKLYIVNSGFLKTVLIDDLGAEQVLSFPMKSDLLGMDGIHTNCHASEAVALSDCDLIVLPFKKLVSLGRSYAELESAMYGLMSRELVREQRMSVMLGSFSAESRVMQFLVSLSDKFGLMGYSSKKFNLRMTRNEIGSYLGLTLETVSRTLSSLADIGLICVDLKKIELLDVNALRVLRRVSPVLVRSKKEKITKPKVATRKTLPIPPRWKHDEAVIGL